MAKRNSTRRTARKPKFIEVEGHQLTPAQHAGYQLCLVSRGRIMGAAADPGKILRMGLDDFLSHHRPSSKIKGQISEIYTRLSRVILAIGAMGDYPFFTPVPSSVRSAGSKVVREMALELYNASAKLTAIATSVEAEETTKLQDWLARDQEIARIGHGAENRDGR